MPKRVGSGVTKGGKEDTARNASSNLSLNAYATCKEEETSSGRIIVNPKRLPENCAIPTISLYTGNFQREVCRHTGLPVGALLLHILKTRRNHRAPVSLVFRKDHDVTMPAPSFYE